MLFASLYDDCDEIVSFFVFVFGQDTGQGTSLLLQCPDRRVYAARSALVSLRALPLVIQEFFYDIVVVASYAFCPALLLPDCWKDLVLKS